MSESHADIADDDSLFRVKSHVFSRLSHTDVMYAQHIADVFILLHNCRIICPRIVPEFFCIFLFRLYRFPVYLIRHRIAKNNF